MLSTVNDFPDGEHFKFQTSCSCFPSVPQRSFWIAVVPCYFLVHYSTQVETGSGFYLMVWFGMPSSVVLYLLLSDHELLLVSGCLMASPGSSHVTTAQLILSGGEGYINFRIGEFIVFSIFILLTLVLHH